MGLAMKHVVQRAFKAARWELGSCWFLQDSYYRVVQQQFDSSQRLLH